MNWQQNEVTTSQQSSLKPGNFLVYDGAEELRKVLELKRRKEVEKRMVFSLCRLEPLVFQQGCQEHIGNFASYL